MCDVDGCEKAPQRQGLCWGHWKRKCRGQTVSVPLVEKGLSPREAVLTAAIEYADAEADNDYAEAERKVLRAAENFGRRRTRERVLEALTRRREAGMPLGRPSRVTPEAVVEARMQLRSARRAAAALGISLSTVRRLSRLAKREGVRKVVSDTPSTADE